MDDCTKRWKALRDKFVRELKKVKKRKSGDSGPVYVHVSCWAHFHNMSFLQDSVRHRT